MAVLEDSIYLPKSNAALHIRLFLKNSGLQIGIGEISAILSK